MNIRLTVSGGRTFVNIECVAGYTFTSGAMRGYSAQKSVAPPDAKPF